MVFIGTTLTFAIAVGVLHFVLLRPGRFQLSSAQWEAVDYVWYGVGLLALLIAGYQVLNAVERARHVERLRGVERYYSFLERVIAAKKDTVYSNDARACALLTDLERSIRETQLAPGWPTGPVLFNGRTFNSLNQVLKERAEEYGLEQVDGIVADVSTILLDTVGDARASERRIAMHVPPLWATVTWPYLMALLIALRVTKVTYKVKEKRQIRNG